MMGPYNYSRDLDVQDGIITEILSPGSVCSDYALIDCRVVDGPHQCNCCQCLVLERSSCLAPISDHNSAFTLEYQVVIYMETFETCNPQNSRWRVQSSQRGTGTSMITRHCFHDQDRPYDAPS